MYGTHDCSNWRWWTTLITSDRIIKEKFSNKSRWTAAGINWSEMDAKRGLRKNYEESHGFLCPKSVGWFSLTFFHFNKLPSRSMEFVLAVILTTQVCNTKYTRSVLSTKIQFCLLEFEIYTKCCSLFCENSPYCFVCLGYSIKLTKDCGAKFNSESKQIEGMYQSELRFWKAEIAGFQVVGIFYQVEILSRVFNVGLISIGTKQLANRARFLAALSK